MAQILSHARILKNAMLRMGRKGNTATHKVHEYGDRVRKNNGSSATEYIYSNGVPIGVYNPSNGSMTDLVWDGSNMFAEVAGNQTATPDYRLTDQLGSLAVLTDGSGNVLGSNVYSPYGDIMSSSTSDSHAYSGLEEDNENGSDHAMARNLALAQGRWLSPDWSAKVEPVPYAKLDNPQSLNLYSYVLNNPITGIDADGHWGCSGSTKGFCSPGVQKQILHGVNPNEAQQQSANNAGGNPAAKHTTSKQGSVRAPDFVSANVNVAIPNPWTLTFVGVTFTVNLDRDGNLYFGLGPTAGKSATGVSGSLTADWLDQLHKPSATHLHGFLTHSSFSGTAGFWGGVQQGWTPGSGFATGVGFVSPQAGVSYTYSWQIHHFNFHW